MILQMQEQLQQQEEKIKELEGDLQTAQRESTADRKRVEVEKFKTKLTNSAQKTEKAAQLFEARLNDELSGVKKENREVQSQQRNPVAVS